MCVCAVCCVLYVCVMFCVCVFMCCMLFLCVCAYWFFFCLIGLMFVLIVCREFLLVFLFCCHFLEREHTVEFVGIWGERKHDQNTLCENFLTKSLILS